MGVRDLRAIEDVLEQIVGDIDDDPLLGEPRQIREIVTNFQERLASIEAEIHRRNDDRAVPYHGMLPSKIPNSASV